MARLPEDLILLPVAKEIDEPAKERLLASGECLKYP